MSEWEDLIDRGLRAYVAQEPPPDMDLHVMKRVRHTSPRVAWWWAGWAAAACGAWVAWIGTRPVETLVIKPVWRVEAPPMATATTAKPVAARRKVQNTEAERALVRFVAEHPEQASKVFARNDSPVAVDEIEIPPLEIEQLQIQEEKK